MTSTSRKRAWSTRKRSWRSWRSAWTNWKKESTRVRGKPHGPPGVALAWEVVPMSVATVASRALAGIEAPQVTVEVHLGPGLPAFHIVGLPDAEVREARDRVRAALNH